MADNSRQLGELALNFGIPDAVVLSGSEVPTSLIKSFNYKKNVFQKYVETPGTDGKSVNRLGANPEDIFEAEGFHKSTTKALALAELLNTPEHMAIVTLAGNDDIAHADWMVTDFTTNSEVDGFSHFSIKLKRSSDGTGMTLVT